MLLDEVNVLSVSRCKYEKGTIVDKHMHDFFHMIYVLSGNGHFQIDNQVFTLNRGELIFCPPEHEHEFVSEGTSSLNTLEVKFKIYMHKRYLPLSNILGCIDLQPADLRRLLEESLEEALRKGYLYKETININITSILLKILKTNNRDGLVCANTTEIQIEDYFNKDIDFSKLFRHIENHLETRITLDELAKIMGFNPEYFCRVFKEKYDISPMHYINALRIMKSKEMLLNSHMSVTEVAERSGFQNVQYFSRCFRKREHVSPLEFKNKYKESIYVNI